MAGISLTRARVGQALFNDPVRSTLMGHWLPLFDGPFRAPEAYLWERGAA